MFTMCLFIVKCEFISWELNVMKETTKFLSPMTIILLEQGQQTKPKLFFKK